MDRGHGPRWINLPTGVLPVLVLALAASSGCEGHRRAPAAAAPVVALPINAQDDVHLGSLRLPAEVCARFQTPLSFRVSGKLIEREVRLGEFVRRGQLLARLDAADAQQQLSSARAALDAAGHRLEFAEQQRTRDTAQAAQNLIAAAQLEQTRDAYTSALAAREQASAQLILAQNNLQYQALHAEHDGWIASENADTGQVLAAGQPVFGLDWSGESDIRVDIAEDQVGLISVGERAAVTLSALPGRRLEADVREIAPAADPVSRTFRVKLTLLSPPRSLRIGMTGEAVLARADAPSAVAGERYFRLPATAIFHQGSQPAVWVVRPGDSTLELRPVRPVQYEAQSILLTGDLKDGEQVLQAGVHTVFAGEAVRAVAPLFSADSSP
jgi:RND family efflux transporter MFP subunit